MRQSRVSGPGTIYESVPIAMRLAVRRDPLVSAFKEKRETCGRVLEESRGQKVFAFLGSPQPLAFLRVCEGLRGVECTGLGLSFRLSKVSRSTTSTMAEPRDDRRNPRSRMILQLAWTAL